MPQTEAPRGEEPVLFRAGDGTAAVLRAWIALAGVLGAALTGLLAGLFTPWLLLLTGAAGLATVVLFLWYPPRYRDSVCGDFDGRAVRAIKGVLWKREIFVPMNALRTFETLNTPLSAHFGCCTVLLRFAGGTAVLPLLDEGDAARLTGLLEEAEEE